MYLCLLLWMRNMEAQHNQYTVSEEGEKTPKRRQRCVTFQGSEVRAPLFPIQPMLWVLFQKVLSLANGPWSHKHRDRVQRRRGGGSEVQQPRGNRRRKKKKNGELGSEWWNTETTTETGSIGLYVEGGGAQPSTTATQQDDQVRQPQLGHENTAGHMCCTHGAQGHVRAEHTG